MKNNIFVIVFIFLVSDLFGQEKDGFYLLETDSTWNQEVFHFPIPFAPDIKFDGFEDARFPMFWSKRDSTDFWSYVFVWSINNPIDVTSSVLETNLELYFDGLMNYQNSTALFVKNDTTSTSNKFIGKLKTFDAIVTKADMILNVTAERFYCDQSKRTCIVFRFSPLEFGEDIWKKLDNVKLRSDFCKT